ncbi:MAG TPA: PKD domain-containing protein [Telluria sp.]|nr:PKD domain-containing protein [Telluria sp.]
MNEADVSKKWRPAWWLPCLLGGLAMANASAAGRGESADAAGAAQGRAACPATYRVVNLGVEDTLRTPAINAIGQVAFSWYSDDFSTFRGWFYDGTSLNDIGNLGGLGPNVTALNDVGQVVGFSERARLDLHANAFLWSRSSGMIDLGTLPGAPYSRDPSINNRGVVVGRSGGNQPPHDRAFRWTAATGMEDLGAFTTGDGSFSLAAGINDSGLIIGESATATPGYHAFVWSRKSGLIDIDTLGNNSSYPVAINAKGQVAGNFSYFSAPEHAFVWSRAGGMRDLGTADGTASFATAINANGQVVVEIEGQFRQAMSWTQGSGMVSLGSLGGEGSYAGSINDKGQVVGVASTATDGQHAFIWTEKRGMIDLNDCLRRAPAGLVVESAEGIAETGAIVARSNAGIVLLVPGHGHKGAPAVGPVAASGLVPVGAPVEAAVSFAAEDPVAQHNVIWSWGDGSGDQAGAARASSGAGSATGNHVYTTPGIYRVTAHVTDLAGNSAAVRRTIVVHDASGGVAGGSGSIASPRRSDHKGPVLRGVANFSFVAPSMTGASVASAKAQLLFSDGGLNFRSMDMQPRGARGQFAGSGTINGAGDYQFAMATTAGAGATGRFSLRIWHLDPATRAEVVDYDSQGAGSGLTADAIVKGGIALQQ